MKDSQYKGMYVLLFNSITDAIRSIEELNYGQASFTLMEAQKNVEELYIGTEEE